MGNSGIPSEGIEKNNASEDGQWYLDRFQDRLQQIDYSPEPIVHIGWKDKKGRGVY